MGTTYINVERSYVCRVFPRRLTGGGFLTIGYWSRTIGYCFLEIFVGEGDKASMEGDKVMIGDPPSPPH